MVSPFQSLCARPPTPPPAKLAVHDNNNNHDADQDAEELQDFLNDPFATKDTVSTVVSAAQKLLSTPQSSPASDSAIPLSSASRRKRVLFEPKPSAIPNGAFTQQTSTPLHSSPLRPLPQTRISKPLKSILKPIDPASTPPPADQNAPAHKFKTFAEMLESITKQLASSIRSSRLDAYHSLQRTMQAYDKVPDVQALVDKTGLLTQFIQRDMQAKGTNESGLDSQLVGQALKLLMALLRIAELRSAMDDGFCIFVVERILQIASDKEMPKTIVNTHLATLMQQNFRSKVMTVTRVERILDIIDTIHDRISGQSVLAYRIRIYKKLLQQKPDVMAKHTGKWFRHLVQSLLSTQKDINQSALETTLAAARTIGTDPQVRKSVLSVLNQRKKDGETITKAIITQLTKMLNTDHAVLVPQIWAVLTALLKDSMDRKEFPALDHWLKLFNGCVDAQSDSVRFYGNFAFGVLMYSVDVSENTDAIWSQFLLVLPRHQLQITRPSQKKSLRSESAYCLLLYYSLNPLASYKQLDRYWKEFVVDFWNPPDSTISPVHAAAACRVVSSLLDGSRKPWDLQRALDLRPQTLMQRAELPLLDPRWVRKSLASILPFVETLLDATPWTTGDSKEESAKTMWLSLLHALKAAGSQEVMASAESKDAMAHIVNAVRRMWDTHVAQLALSQQKEDNWANKFCFLVESTIENLGALSFIDKCLAQSQRDGIQVASTPSRSRQPGPRTSPLLYFVDLLVNGSEGKLADAVRIRALELLVVPCFNSQSTRLTKLEMLSDCCAAIISSPEAVVSVAFWAQVGALAKSCLGDQPLDSTIDGSRQLGKEYDIIVQILSWGFAHFSKQPLGKDLLTSFIRTVRREAGEGGLVLAVIEKISERVLNSIPEAKERSGLPFLSILLQNLPKTVTRRTIEQSRQQLYPSVSKSGRHTDFDPYDHLYASITSIGGVVYHQLNVYDAEASREFLGALASSIRSCPITLLAVFLRKIQQPIRLWVEDADKRLQSKEQWLQDLHAEVVNLWNETCAALEKLPKTDNDTLRHLDILVTAGFVSRRRNIVKASVSMWNTTFGKQDSLQYPEQLEQALQKLRNTFTITLPALEPRTEDTVSFYDSDGNVNTPMRRLKSPRVKESPFRIIKNGRKSRSPAVSSAHSRRASARTTPKARLRHDDSQIEFQPIAHPPPLVAQESQVLTERQREMADRQAVTSNLFAAIGTTSSPIAQSTVNAVDDPHEILSDASVASDLLPVQHARTPLRRIAPVGPMDVFVGSSPTPHVRNRTREVNESDQVTMATPTHARMARPNDEVSVLGSSPPRMEKDPIAMDMEYKQFEVPSMSFDEGTTIEEAIENADWQSREPANATSNTPSSTIDLQLNAQFDADMHPQESNDKSTEAAMEHQEASRAGTELPANPDEMDTSYDTEVDEGTTELNEDSAAQVHDADINDISRVEDSFSSYAADAESSQMRTTRSSARQSATSSPAPSINSTKRPRGRPKKIKAESRGRPRKHTPDSNMADTPSITTPVSAKPEVEVLDNIVVASPTIPGRRTRHSLPAGIQSEVPEPLPKRGVRRSASMLSQMETQADTVGDSTPTPKRARANLSQDVSEAKRIPSSQTKQLSYVRVTPRSHSSASKGRARDIASDVAPQVSDGTKPDVVRLEVTQPDQSQSQSQEHSQLSAPREIATPGRSFTERIILTPRSIINQLKSFKDALLRNSQLVLGRREEREIDDTLFDIRREIYAAGRRSEDGKQ
ncbi:hypothetical protein DM02DRAFT_725329 [Periconia macrospinosa]|uniref:Telomere-associated protein Rif1 N-terminal domain-containing protein n=1 Tax=Periconia macrospinosa TaxID=97972 RepID=A0A2V1E737_9PLEO|nr:hypothetical protein DM02DRAFT_725329 [Periconia macrospinosa]